MAMIILPSLSLGLWAIAFVCLARSVVRLYRGPAVKRPGDEWRSVVFYAAILFMCFNGRRLLIPSDAQFIIALYAISILLASHVLITLGQERR